MVDLKKIKEKLGAVLEPALIGVQRIGGGSIIRKSDEELIFTGSEADDCVLHVTPFGGLEEGSKDISSAFFLHPDGSFNYPQR